MNYIEDVLINNRKRAAAAWTAELPSWPSKFRQTTTTTRRRRRRRRGTENVNNYFMVHRLAVFPFRRRCVYVAAQDQADSGPRGQKEEAI